MSSFSEKMKHSKTKKKLESQKKSNRLNIGKYKKVHHYHYQYSDYDYYSPVPESPFKGKAHHIPANTPTFLEQIDQNSKVSKNRRRWNKIVMRICAFLLITSFSSYMFLSRNILLPSRSSIYRFLSSYELVDVENIVSIEKVDTTIDNYRKIHNINEDTKIAVVLAVDAVALNQKIKINENGDIEGTIKKMKLKEDEMKKLKLIVENQEELLKKLKKKTISNAFVFYFQPLSPIYKCFTIFIHGTISGKAGSEQMTFLPILKEILEKKNFNVVSYASDGDSAYHKLRDNNLKKWDTKERPILDLTDVLYTNDPLHIIKRGRYRLLSHKLVKLYKNEETIDVSLIKDLTNLPSIVFDDSTLTKMHDHLPLQLFTLENLDILLYAEQYSAASYFFPFVMLNEAISAKDLSINERVDFLEITVKYCNYYKELYKKIPKKERANQKGKKKCVLFDPDLIDDLMTTAITINSIINNIAGVILLNRIGTNPLEHHFGLIRLMCHFQHNFEKFVREEQKVKILDEIKQITIGNIITHRKETYGEIVITSDCPQGEESLFTNDDIAISVLWKLGFPISKINKKSNCYNEIAYSNFLQKMKKAKNKHKLSNHKYILNSNDFNLGSSSGAYIKQRLEKKSIIKDE